MGLGCGRRDFANHGVGRLVTAAAAAGAVRDDEHQTIDEFQEGETVLIAAFAGDRNRGGLEREHDPLLRRRLHQPAEEQHTIVRGSLFRLIHALPCLLRVSQVRGRWERLGMELDSRNAT